MESDAAAPKPDPARRATLAAALACAAVGLWLGLVAARHPRWTWDGAVYVLTAEELRASGRMRSTITQLQADAPWPAPDGRSPAPGQAPGYPLLLAALGTSRGALGGALAWNALAHAAAAGLTALLAARLAGPGRAGALAALAAGLATAGSVPLLARVPWTLSESTYVACQAAALVTAVAACQGRSLALAGLAAGSACAFRTAGVALFVPLAWVVLDVARREGRRAGARAAVALFAPPVLALLAVPLRGEPAALVHYVPRGSLEAAGQVAALLLSIAVATNWGPATAGLAGAACGVAWLLDLVGRRRGDVAPAPPGAPVPLLALGGAAGLLFVGFHKLLYPEGRYGVPLLPPLLALLAAPAARLAAARVTSARVAGAVALALLAGLPVAYAALRLDPPPAPVPFADTTTMAWVASSTPPGETVVTNVACWVAWETGRPAAQLPERNLHLVSTDPAWVLTALRGCRARHLVLFRGMAPAGFGPTVAALQRGEAVSPDLAVVWSGADGVVWRLREP